MYKWQIIERCVLLYEIPVYFYYEMHTFSLCVFTAIYEIRIYIYTHSSNNNFQRKWERAMMTLTEQTSGACFSAPATRRAPVLPLTK